jgi:DNA helicase II / ATP-dependent DNA helicase PcrA
MAGRIRAVLGPDAAPHWLGTFHGLAARQLRAGPEVASLRDNFDILDADDSRGILRRIMKTMNLWSDEDDEGGKRDPVKIVAGHIGKFKDLLMTPKGARSRVENRIAEGNRTGASIDVAGLTMAATVYPEYQTRLREANAADFGDLLLWPTLALVNDPDYRTRWAGKFDWAHADEYQDVNFAQYTWLKTLASYSRRMFIVGDDDQSIFGWRGADVAFIRRFRRDFPDAVDIRLEENFRSTGHILAAANAIIAEDKARLGKTLFTRKGQGSPVELMSFRDGDAEAAGLADALIARKGEGARWAEMAVLYRNNFLSRAFEEALMRAKIPYRLVGDVGFYARAEVKSALALLRLAALLHLAAMPDDRQSDEAFRRVINEPRRGFGAKAIEILGRDATFFGVSLLKAVETAALPPKTKEAAVQFVEHIRAVGDNTTLTLADQLSLLLDRTGYRAMLRESRAENMEQKLENLGELIDIAGGFHSAREFLDHAALATNRERDGDKDAVSLMTLHKAKGLEFPHVFLPAFEAGIIPSSYGGDIDEERRLAYVALTRGMRQVRISWALYRRGPAEPSPFVDAIPERSRVFLSRPNPKHLSPQARAGLRHIAGRLRRHG